MDIDAGEPEHVLCKRWREEVMELSRPQLAALTGYSAAAIKDFERADKIVDAMARKRYRLACAAAVMGIQFDWVETVLEISRPVEITIGKGRSK